MQVKIENKPKNCAISRWDDPKEINESLEKLTKEPIWEQTMIITIKSY